MSTTVGSIAVSMGVDLAEFQAGMTKATALATSNTALMSAEMKRQSREGAESMRLIDEAIGVHISRPLTRVIAQLPGIGTALAALGGIGGVAGIFALISVGWEKLEPLMERVGKQFGLVRESADEAAKSMAKGNQEVIQSLERKIELQDAYNRLVLHLPDAAADAAHVEALKKESDLLFDIFFKEKARLELKEAELTWVGKIGKALGVTAGMMGLGFVFDNEAKGRFAEYQKQLEQINPILERSKEKADEAAKGGMQVLNDQFKDLLEELKPLNKEAEDFWVRWQKINDEIDKATGATFFNDYKMKLGFEGLGDRLAEAQKGLAAYKNVTPPSGAPLRADQVELIKIQKDQNEAYRKAGEIVTQVATPMQKYKDTVAILKEEFRQGRLTFDQFAEGMRLAGVSVQQAETHTRRLELQLIKLLESSDSASAGMRAFWLQLQIDNAPARFTFEILNQAVRGFEDNVASMLTRGKADWRSYFELLTQMATKYALTAGLLQIGKTGFGQAIAGALGLGKSSTAESAAIIAAASTLQLSGTLLSTAGSSLELAAVQMSAAAASLSAAGAASGTGAFSLLGVPLMAGGGDATPGASYIVGDAGPELLTMGANGGFITSNGAMEKSGGGSTYYIDARGADAGVEQRMMRLIRDSEDRAVVRSISGVTELNRRTPR